MAIPNVTFIRPEVANLLPLYYLIRDCISGEVTIKAATTKYLPQPNAEDVSTENKERYKAYVLRAVFYNVTRRTLLGLIGQVFMRDPVITAPSFLKPIIEDASGTGLSLILQSKKSTQLTTAFSRSGLFVDYPSVEGGATIADLASGNVRPTISVYPPHQILNWRVVERGAKEMLSLVVIYEGYCVEDDGFEMKNSPQYRVLKLDEQGNYIQEIWREPTAANYVEDKPPKRGNFLSHQIIEMKGPDGNPLKEIPFMFLGSDNNDTHPDNPNMYDLASLNIAHYRNSADYEESCYQVGQPTLIATGLTEEWYKDVLKEKFSIGSRGGIPLPVGADAKLIQAEPNTMLKEAMEMKERQMVALGAKLVEQKQVQRTAFETKVEATGEGSVLSSVAQNISAGYTWALKWCARFMGLAETGILVSLNTDYDISRMTPEEQKQAIENWQKGAVTFGEMRTILKKAGAATEDDEIAKQTIAKDSADAMAMAMALNEAGAKSDDEQAQ